MAESRRERIEAMLSEDPTDDFLRYGLALEWIEEGQHERGLGDLRQLMEQEVPYLPAFPVAGKLLARLGRRSEARAVLRAGIETARRQGEAHAAGEMAEFLTAMGVPPDPS